MDLFQMVRGAGIGHDKFPLKIFSTPPHSVTFVIRAPALRSAIHGASHPHGCGFNYLPIHQ